MTSQPLNSEQQQLLDDLLAPQKSISSAWLYDQRGSQLFDQITRLKEYYPTRTEIGILTAHRSDIAEMTGEKASIIEFGSGSSEKIRILLRCLNLPAVYVPVDISAEHLELAAAGIRDDFPDLEVIPVVANFTQEFDLPEPVVMPEKNLVFFPGSTIGNFRPDEARELLKVMAVEAGKGGSLLIGVDLVKDPGTLELAYNDQSGVTAAFNLNILEHLNRVHGSDFRIDQFGHHAFFNATHHRIEMHLISLIDQTVTLLGQTIVINQDETILTEYSHKYSIDDFVVMVESTGFVSRAVWTDEDQLFSVHYFDRADSDFFSATLL